eukprot:2422864-Prymnesium_polylepis.1
MCDDGGDGSTYNVCPLGSDCTDCGARVPSPFLPPRPPAAPAFSDVVLSGLPGCQAALAGTYTLQGRTGNGDPYYANAAAGVPESWIYYDPDCAGSGQPARWILGDSMPDASRFVDLDNDGTCSYAGDIITADARPPFGTQAWALFCDGSWISVDLTLATALPSPPAPPVAPPPPIYRELVVSGVCPSRPSYGGTYTLQGRTGNGAPYYVNALGASLFYDLD